LTEKKISIFIGGEKYFEFNNEETGPDVWPFDKNFYLLLDITVGGNWGCKMGMANSIFLREMQIDYLRVWQKK